MFCQFGENMKINLEFEVSSIPSFVINFSKDHLSNDNAQLKAMTIDGQKVEHNQLTDYVVNTDIHTDAQLTLPGCDYLGQTGTMIIEIGDVEMLKERIIDPENMHTRNDYAHYKRALEYFKKKFKL